MIKLKKLKTGEYFIIDTAKLCVVNANIAAFELSEDGETVTLTTDEGQSIATLTEEEIKTRMFKDEAKAARNLKKLVKQTIADKKAEMAALKETIAALKLQLKSM